MNLESFRIPGCSSFLSENDVQTGIFFWFGLHIYKLDKDVACRGTPSAWRAGGEKYGISERFDIEPMFIRLTKYMEG